MKGALKYYIISIVNLIVLTALHAIWTDRFELIFNNVRPFEFIKIIGITIISLLATRLLLYIFNKKNVTNNKVKLSITIITTLLISSYIYIDYSVWIIDNRFINKTLRDKAQAKVYNVSAMGYEAKNLTIEEYDEIIKLTKFPVIPKQSTHIYFSFSFDDFLPDYSLSIEYYLPIDIKADTMFYQDGDYSKQQKVDIVNNKQKVSYYESLQ